jgi:flagellin-like protein
LGTSKRWLRKKRALAPVFATLILVAVTVISGIVVYLFTSGYMTTMMGGGTTGQEKVAIEAVGGSAATGLVSAYAKSVGGGSVIIEDALLKDSSGTTIEVLTLAASVTLPNTAALTQVDCAFAMTSMTAGNVYTVTLVSREGNQFVSPSFKAT